MKEELEELADRFRDLVFEKRLVGFGVCVALGCAAGLSSLAFSDVVPRVAKLLEWLATQRGWSPFSAVMATLAVAHVLTFWLMLDHVRVDRRLGQVRPSWSHGRPTGVAFARSVAGASFHVLVVCILIRAVAATNGIDWPFKGYDGLYGLRDISLQTAFCCAVVLICASWSGSGVRCGFPASTRRPGLPFTQGFYLAALLLPVPWIVCRSVNEHAGLPAVAAAFFLMHGVSGIIAEISIRTMDFASGKWLSRRCAELLGQSKDGDSVEDRIRAIERIGALASGGGLGPDTRTSIVKELSVVSGREQDANARATAVDVLSILGMFVVPGLGMGMVRIEPGSFMMGSENGVADEGPRHEVTLTNGFWMGQYAVTQAEYEQIMGEENTASLFEGARRPAENVSWLDATEFCSLLTARERAKGSLDPGQEYRLPTEAEWEYCCRAGATGQRYGPLNDIAWHSSNSGGRTHDVGEKLPNAWGLYDMLGNTWEWCADWFGAYPIGSVSDPLGPSSGSFRVLRGGSWRARPSICRSVSRLRFEPTKRYNCDGFRVARGCVLDGN